MMVELLPCAHHQYPDYWLGVARRHHSWHDLSIFLNLFPAGSITAPDSHFSRRSPFTALQVSRTADRRPRTLQRRSSSAHDKED